MAPQGQAMTWDKMCLATFCIMHHIVEGDCIRAEEAQASCSPDSRTTSRRSRSRPTYGRPMGTRSHRYPRASRNRHPDLTQGNNYPTVVTSCRTYFVTDIIRQSHQGIPDPNSCHQSPAPLLHYAPADVQHRHRGNKQGVGMFAPFDARIEYRGEFCFIFPLTDKGTKWIKDHIEEPTEIGARGVLVSTAEVDGIIDAMIADDLWIPVIRTKRLKKAIAWAACFSVSVLRFAVEVF